jgi:cobalamin biosynthesis Mg chelatase CobN
VTTLDATNITSRSAVLRASINSNSLNTTYDFLNETSAADYMTDDGNYIFTIGPYNGSLNVSANVTKIVAISSLQPNTNYTFKVRAQNDAGVTIGNVLSFMTLAETTTTTTTTTQSSTSTTSSTSSTTTTTQPPTTSTTSATNATTTTTTTTQGGGFFGNVWNIIFAIVLGIAIFAAVFFMYRRGWHL